MRSKAVLLRPFGDSDIPYKDKNPLHTPKLNIASAYPIGNLDALRGIATAADLMFEGDLRAMFDACSKYALSLSSHFSTDISL